MVPMNLSEVWMFKRKLLEVKDEKQMQTCDSGSKHWWSWSLVVDRGDGHIVLSLGDEAGQVQGGDVAVDLNLPVENLIIINEMHS